jgi:hypothetical protein
MIIKPGYSHISDKIKQLTLKLEVIRSSEMSLNFYWTGRYIPGGSPFHNHHCENLKSNNFTMVHHSLVFHSFSVCLFLCDGLQNMETHKECCHIPNEVTS